MVQWLSLPASAGQMGWIPSPGRLHMPWGNQPHVPQPLKPWCPTVWAPQQKESPQ